MHAWVKLLWEVIVWHESLLTSHPHAAVLYIGDFNVHHTDWLQSTHTDVGGIEAFHFSISNELQQIIKHPTRVPDRHDHAANTLDLFFTSNPQNYTYTVSFPLGSSDHCTVCYFVFYSTTTYPSHSASMTLWERPVCWYEQLSLRFSMEWLLLSDLWSWPGSYSSWRRRGFRNEGIHSVLFNNFLSF